MKKYSVFVCIVLIVLLSFNGCSIRTENKADKENNVTIETNEEDKTVTQNDKPSKEYISCLEEDSVKDKNSDSGQEVVYSYNHDLNMIEDNNRTYYEVFLYSFYDSDGDGIGDINGLISKLDYINDGDPTTDTDLGFSGIWLMPIMPSSTYHKYDVIDYYNIDKQYGTLDDFKRLIEECKKRGIKVIIDLVINHSSNQNPWFTSALKSLTIKPCKEEICTHEELCREHNPYVKYYNFVEGKPDTGSYYPTGVGDWYYEGVFTSNMPDLNLEDENLRSEIENIISFWLDLGVGGFRLDAALHYYSDNTDKNVEVLSWLNDFIKEQNTENYMVAEVWTNFSTYSKYYASGIDSIFNFAFATECGKIVKTINYSGFDNSAQSFGNAMIQVQKGIKKYNEDAIDAPFFTNHDTARASGYFVGDSNKIKMAAGMNLCMNGSVFVYYGEEIGMSGSGKDENKRAPMYWSTKDTTGMTKGPANMDQVTHEFGSVEEQVMDSSSIYNYYKRAIRLRNENPEIARGEIAYMKDIAEGDICAITKTYEESKIIMLYNISDVKKEIVINKEIYDYQEIRGYLSATGEEVLLEGDTLTLPAYSIVVLK